MVCLTYTSPETFPQCSSCCVCSLRAAREEREKRRGSTVPPSPEKDTNESETGSTSGQTRQSSVERSGENEDRLVPQLRIGADGNIVIDEARWVLQGIFLVFGSVW